MKIAGVPIVLLLGTAISLAATSGSTIDATMTWDSVTRYYEVYLPPQVVEGTIANPALVMMLHGTNFDAPPDNPSTVNWEWQPFANEYGFILVQPASTYDPNSGQWNWNAYFMDSAFPAPAPDDVGFLRQLIVKLTAQYKVNPNMVYVTGFSSGAQMAERVGVEISDLVAAIAPASGQLVGQEGVVSPPLPRPTAPSPFPPISVQEWQGTEDKNLWPCGYGTTVYSGVTFTLDTVDDTFNYWVRRNNCTSLQTKKTLCSNGVPNNANDAPTPGIPGMTGNVAKGCAAPGAKDVEVQFIWEPDVAHSFQWKNNAARWAFFAAHPKQPAK